MYANINVQHSCKILQNYLKSLMSNQQQIVGATFWQTLYTVNMQQTDKQIQNYTVLQASFLNARLNGASSVKYYW